MGSILSFTGRRTFFFIGSLALETTGDASATVFPLPGVRVDSSADCERRIKLEALAKLTTASLESEILSIALVEVDVFRESNSEGEGSAGEDDRLACCFD